MVSSIGSKVKWSLTLAICTWKVCSLFVQQFKKFYGSFFGIFTCPTKCSRIGRFSTEIILKRKSKCLCAQQYEQLLYLPCQLIKVFNLIFISKSQSNNLLKFLKTSLSLSEHQIWLNILLCSLYLPKYNKSMASVQNDQSNLWDLGSPWKYSRSLLIWGHLGSLKRF